jgi:glycosyltransferase involved in cell wall biosynthesis
MLLAKPYVIDSRVKNEASSLITHGYTVHVLSWDRDGRQPPSFELDGVKVRSLKLIGGSSFSGLGYFLSAMLLQLYAFFWCLRNIKGQFVLHANDLNTLLGGVLVKLVRGSSVRLVYDCHELTPSVYMEWFNSLAIGVTIGVIEKELMKRADALVTVSPGLQAYLGRESGRQVTILFNTPRLALAPREEKKWWRERLDLEGFVVSFVGTLRRDAALDELVSAARRFKENGLNGITFVVVGSGPDWNRLKEMVVGLEGYFKLIPDVPYPMALGYVRASDLSFAVYRYAERGRSDGRTRHWLLGGSEAITMHWKVSEAMACGTCALLNSKTSEWEFVSRIGSGLPAGNGTTEEVYRAVKWAFENPEVVEAKGQAGRQEFVSNFNWEAMSGRLARIYGWRQ